MRRLFAICVFMFAPAGAWAVDSADQQARALFAADWQWRLQNQPEFATAVGDHRYDAALSDTSLVARERLTGQDQLSYDLFVEQKERLLKAAGFYPYKLQPITTQDGKADTGIHALGWSRQQAIDYLGANTANAPADNEVELDRYIAAPGQALGYKIGQLKIAALREKAQAALGERFDLRSFHGAVLDNAALPLPMLEQQVERWIRATLRDAAAPKAPSSGSLRF